MSKYDGTLSFSDDKSTFDINQYEILYHFSFNDFIIKTDCYVYMKNSLVNIHIKLTPEEGISVVWDNKYIEAGTLIYHEDTQSLSTQDNDINDYNMIIYFNSDVNSHEVAYKFCRKQSDVNRMRGKEKYYKIYLSCPFPIITRTKRAY